MSKKNHPIEQEELMAYLDGELATNRAIAAAAHLEHCAECQELAADLRKLSQEMMAWEVEQVEGTEIPAEILTAEEKPSKGRGKGMSLNAWNIFSKSRKLVWAVGSAVSVLLVSGALIINVVRYQPMAMLTDQHRTKNMEIDARLIPHEKPAPPPRVSGFNGSIAGKSKVAGGGGGDSTQLVTSTNGTIGDESVEDQIDSSDRTVPTVPMIARVAALTLTTKEFDKTRASLEEILKGHSGYMGELKVSAVADAGRSLTATLRIPAQQLDAAMTELKKLGRVEDESQGGEEVTQQYVDLQARLANGIHTEQRLTEILRSRTGKLQDVLKVELEIDRVQGEIEEMQAEKKELSKRVAFATLNTTIKEEYLAKLQSTPPSTGSRFRNAAVDGYNTVVEGLIDISLFLLSAGPSLLLWAAILFFPARWAWKKFVSGHGQADADEQKSGG